MSETYSEMRLVRCPGCGDALESRHWDDLADQDSETYDCDCGTSYSVTWREGRGYVVEES